MYNFGDIIEIIDNSIADEKNIMFVCDYDLAESISAYLYCEYGIEDEENSLDEDVNEHYVSLFYNDNINFIVESAKGYSGKFKLSDVYSYDHYIQSGLMLDSEIYKYLQGENCTWNLFGYDDTYDCEDCGCCNGCEDCDTCEEDIECLIDEYVERIQDIGLCPNCLRDCLQNFVDELMN